MQGVEITPTRFVCFEEPVGLVRRSASDDQIWRAQREALAEEFRVITHIRRSHGPNDPITPGADYRPMPPHWVWSSLPPRLRAPCRKPILLGGWR